MARRARGLVSVRVGQVQGLNCGLEGGCRLFVVRFRRLLDLAGQDAGRGHLVVGSVQRHSLLDGATLDDESARGGYRVVLNLLHVVAVVGVVGVVGVRCLAQLSLVAFEARQLDLKVRAGGGLPGGAEGDW